MTGIGWILAVIEPTPAGEIAMTMISAGKTTIFVVDTVQEGIEKFNKMAEASAKNEKIGKGMAEAHKKGETEGGSGGTIEPEKNNSRDTEKNGKNESKIDVHITSKIAKQLENRGWTSKMVEDVVNNPFTTRAAKNKSTGNMATTFYTKSGDYVVRDNVSGEVVQISDKFNPNWHPDSTIVNPYKVHKEL